MKKYPRVTVVVAPVEENGERCLYILQPASRKLLVQARWVACNMALEASDVTIC